MRWVPDLRPGYRRWIRTHSWTSIGIAGAATFLVALTVALRGERAPTDPPPPPPAPVPDWVVDRSESARASGVLLWSLDLHGGP